jgi:hypothetical protein
MGALNCVVDTQNITKSQCEARYGLITKAMFSPENTGLSFADGLLESSWIAEANKTASERLTILPEANDVVRNAEETQFFEGNTSRRRRSRKGRVDFMMSFFDLADCEWEKYLSLDGQRRYVTFVTENEAIVGTDNGTNIQGMLCDIFVDEPTPPENKDGFWTTKVYIYLVETEANFTKVLLPNEQSSGSWRPSTLEGLVDVTITDNGSVVNSLVVDITGDCDNREITELITADFLVTDAANVTETVTATSSGNTYTLAGTLPADTYTVTLKNQPDMTTKGYENQISVDITVA